MDDFPRFENRMRSVSVADGEDMILVEREDVIMLIQEIKRLRKGLRSIAYDTSTSIPRETGLGGDAGWHFSQLARAIRIAANTLEEEWDG